MANTRGYPTPGVLSPATVPADLQKLADAIAVDVQTVSDTALAARSRAEDAVGELRNVKVIDEMIDNGDGTITVRYTNGESVVIALPQGPPGEPGPAAGPFRDVIDNGDGTITVVLDDGTERVLTSLQGAPGDPGEDGDPGPANSLSIGSVTSGTAPSATITGTPPSQTLDLVLPKGEKGDPGDAGEATTPDTGTRNIGTEAGGASIGNVRVRRVGSLVALAFSGAIPASGSLRWNYPTGFKPIDSMTGHRAGWNITKENFFPFQVAWNATTVPASGGGPVAGDYVSAVVQYITADPWPTTLPGTPG